MDIKFYDNTIVGGVIPYDGCLAHMVDVSNYDFTYLTDKKIKPLEYFINLYVNECLKYESAISSTQRMHRILVTK